MVRLRCRYYSLFTLGMLVVFECTTVFQRMRHLNELRALQTPKQALQASLKKSTQSTQASSVPRKHLEVPEIFMVLASGSVCSRSWPQ